MHALDYAVAGMRLGRLEQPLNSRPGRDVVRAARHSGIISLGLLAL